MSSARSCAVGVFLLSLASAHFLTLAFHPGVDGIVADANGPVPDATVGWQGECKRVTTDSHGRFYLPRSQFPRRLIATKPGYRIASSASNSLRLELLPTADDDTYTWIDPHPDATQPNNCGNCHGEIYREWRKSAHARSATNPKFLNLFASTEHKTWNARLEHPDGSAVCATCHVPTLTSSTLEYDVREADGIHKSGIHCDYCHKVDDVPAGKFGRRFGRDGMQLLRAPPGDLLTFGPLDDAVRAGESFAHRPVFKESRYCASCHEGTVFGVHAYGTYSEWLESPAKVEGKQCQDCHMAPTGKMTNIAPGNGGIERDPFTLASHRTPGGVIDMLRHALSITLTSSMDSDAIRANVEIIARNVGHRVPTGFPDRHLVLMVTAVDANGNPVEPIAGTRLPSSAGKWAGRAGSLFAKQLHDEHGRTPTPYWRHVDKVTDTRLVPDRPERQIFAFPPAARTITAQLRYRRFWPEIADARGWNDNDVLVIEHIATMIWK